MTSLTLRRAPLAQRPLRREGQMTETETALQMAERHVAEQEIRVLEQENLIVRLRSEGRPSEQAEGMLVEMRHLLDDMRDHLERQRLRQRPEA
jgi:hypothetical protein